MAVSDFRELQCWQLANSLRQEVIALCETEQAASDFKFCGSFRDAAGSVCRNIAEGFSRYRSGEIVQFFGYALASLAEVQDHLEECRARRLVPEAELARLSDLAEHTRATALKFMRFHKRRRTYHGGPSKARPPVRGGP
jgi:four helix bundle protein